MSSFEQVFGASPEVAADAPGRVNLLGEHTDYNEGFVLPTAIAQRTRVALRRNGGEDFALYSENLKRSARFDLVRAPADRFATYVYGCIRVLADNGVPVPALDIHVASDVPIGVGLSSSAALEVATLRALRALLNLNLSDIQLAQFAQRAEVEHAHVNCGILDQMACSLLAPGAMLYLDTRTLERRLLPLPAHSELLVIDSGVVRELAASGYNERRAQCEAAARMLGVRALRDVTDPQAVERLPEPLRRRARHVMTENARVQAAAAGLDAAAFGAAMTAAHCSLRDDYDVSIPQIDRLIALLLADARVYGAKLTGAGFGGACVALCAQGSARAVGAAVLHAYRTPQLIGKILVPPQ